MLVFIYHSAKMDIRNCLFLDFKLKNEVSQAQIHEILNLSILRNRLTTSLYVTLLPSLGNYEPKFFSYRYFRMSIKSFDDLLEPINTQCAAAVILHHEELSVKCWSSNIMLLKFPCYLYAFNVILLLSWHMKTFFGPFSSQRHYQMPPLSQQK